MGIFQSTYRQGSMRETALHHGQTGILMGMDKYNVVFLVLLDFWVAYYASDHVQLVNGLSARHRIGGITLQRFFSYLSDHSQTITIGYSHSAS